MRTKTPYFLPTSFTQTTALVERLIAENIQGFLKPSELNKLLEAVDCLNSDQEPLRAVSEPDDLLAALDPSGTDRTPMMPKKCDLASRSNG